MALNGSSERFSENETQVDAEALNSLDMGGNVFQSAVGGLKVDVTAIRGLIADAEVDYAGVSEQLLTASQSNYMYLNSAGVLTISTSAFPTYGTGSGQEQFLPLAVVVCTVDNVSTITDKRYKFYA